MKKLRMKIEGGTWVQFNNMEVEIELEDDLLANLGIELEELDDILAEMHKHEIPIDEATDELCSTLLQCDGPIGDKCYTEVDEALPGCFAEVKAIKLENGHKGDAMIHSIECLDKEELVKVLRPIVEKAYEKFSENHDEPTQNQE